jgi:hypothetical protein
MVHRKPEDLAYGRRRSLSLLDGVAEQQLEAWAGCAEVRGGREREVHLKATGEQKEAVHGGTLRKVKEVDPLEFPDDDLVPVVEHIGERGVLRDAECEVEIGPAVACTAHRAAYGCPGEKARIGTGQLEQALPHPVSFFNREQAAILSKTAPFAVASAAVARPPSRCVPWASVRECH